MYHVALALKFLVKSEFLKDEMFRLLSFQVQRRLIYLPFLCTSHSVYYARFATIIVGSHLKQLSI